MSVNLDSICRQIRIDILTAIYHARSGHPGGSLSCTEILAVLFHQVLTPNTTQGHDSFTPNHFVLSKGHAAPALYAAAASIKWLTPAQIKTLRKIGSPLQGHPDVNFLKWVETCTGSLGQGLSAATGMAMGAKLQKASDSHTYCVIGDGELQEGQVWEAAMFASHHKLDNLTVIIDYNKLQSDDFNKNISALEPLADRWRHLGWCVTEVDGHSTGGLYQALRKKKDGNQPHVIIAHTVKGKGVNYMENIPKWHGSVALSDEQFKSALEALDVTELKIKEYQRGE